MIPLGPFELIRPIGRGGSCEVWAARHREQGLPVAVKVVFGKKAQTPRFISAFREEVRAVAGLNHPSIVMVFDYGLIPAETAAQSGGKLQAGSPYLVMELADDTLHASCDRLGWKSIYTILLSLLDALAHAHARGVIHRDIKPANILINHHPRQIKLSDFGLAHAVERGERPRHARELVGTPSYMAPEQFELRWRDYGPWTDLYAFGCTTHTLLCGFPPFGRTEQIEEMMAAHLYRSIPRLPPRLPVPPGFEEWLHRLLQKDPAHRFQRAADAAWALMQLEENRDPREPLQVWDEEERTSPFAPRVPALELREFEDLEGPTLHALQTLVGTPTPSAAPAIPVRFSHILDEPSVAEETASGADELPPLPTEDRVSLAEPEVTMEHPPEVSQPFEAYWSQGSEQGLAEVSSSEQHPPPEKTRSLKGGSVSRSGLGASAETAAQPSLYAMAMPVELPPIPPFPETWRRESLNEQSRLLDDVGLGLYGLRSVPLVGREQERDLLWNALAQVVQQRRGHVVSLRGPVGCGKSRLAEWLCERAHEVGAARVLKAVHSPIRGPADGFGAMLSRYLRCSGLNRREILSRVESMQISRTPIGVEESYALTELIAPASRTDDVGPEEPPLIRFGNPTERYEVVRKFIERLSERRAVILWLDDVHWSFDALSFVSYVLESQQWRPIPLLVVMTAQEEALVERENEAAQLSEILARPHAEEIEIGPLSPEENTALVQELLGLRGELALQVETCTAGNPMFAIQLVGDWVQRGLLERSAQGFRLRPGVQVEIPDSLHEVWTDRIDQVLARHFQEEAIGLELAATLGIEIDREEWVEVCNIAGVPVPDALLEDLFELRLAYAIPDGTGGSWGFVHSMLRESLERRARESGRWEAHQQACAEMLQKKRGRRGTAERLGRHLLLAGDLRAAIKPLLKGIWEHVDDGNFRLAELLFVDWKSNLTRLKLPPENEYWGEAWLLQARIARGTGAYEEGRKIAALLVRDARKFEWDRILIFALLELANCSWRLGVDEEQVWLLLEEAEQRARQSPKKWAECRRYMGNFLCGRGRLQEAARHLQDALATFEKLGDEVGMARCCYGMSNVERQAGRFAQARLYIQLAQEHYEAFGSRRGIVDCLNSLGDLARFEGDLAQSEAYYRDSLARYEALGSGDVAISQLNIVLVLIERRRYHETREILTKVISQLQEKGQRDLEGIAHLCMMPVLAVEGNWDEWDYHLREARALLGDTGLCDVDTAQVAEHAGDLARELGQQERAFLAYEFAMEQWLLLGRTEEVQNVRKRMSS